MKMKNANVVPCDSGERGEMAVRMLNTLAQNDPDAWIENYPVSSDAILDPVPRAVVMSRRNLRKRQKSNDACEYGEQKKAATPGSSLADSWSGPEIDRETVRSLM